MGNGRKSEQRMNFNNRANALLVLSAVMVLAACSSPSKPDISMTDGIPDIVRADAYPPELYERLPALPVANGLSAIMVERFERDAQGGMTHSFETRPPLISLGSAYDGKYQLLVKYLTTGSPGTTAFRAMAGSVGFNVADVGVDGKILSYQRLLSVHSITPTPCSDVKGASWIAGEFSCAQVSASAEFYRSNGQDTLEQQSGAISIDVAGHENRKVYINGVPHDLRAVLIRMDKNFKTHREQVELAYQPDLRVLLDYHVRTEENGAVTDDRGYRVTAIQGNVAGHDLKNIGLD